MKNITKLDENPELYSIKSFNNEFVITRLVGIIELPNFYLLKIGNMQYYKNVQDMAMLCEMA